MSKSKTFFLKTALVLSVFLLAGCSFVFESDSNTGPKVKEVQMTWDSLAFGSKTYPYLKFSITYEKTPVKTEKIYATIKIKGADRASVLTYTLKNPAQNVIISTIDSSRGEPVVHYPVEFGETYEVSVRTESSSTYKKLVGPVLLPDVSNLVFNAFNGMLRWTKSENLGSYRGALIEIEDKTDSALSQTVNHNSEDCFINLSGLLVYGHKYVFTVKALSSETNVMSAGVSTGEYTYTQLEEINIDQVIDVNLSAINKIDSWAGNVQVNNSKGKTFYLAKVNVQGQSAYVSNTRTVSGFVSLENFSEPGVEEDALENTDGLNFYCGTSDIILEEDNYCPRAVANYSSKPKDYKLGDSKQLILQTADGYKETTCYLRAIREHCYVWVPAAYFSEIQAVPAKGIVSFAEVQAYADCFEKVYETERNIFGNESNVYCGTLNMESSCDTGTKINIVMFDIEGDGGRSTGNGYTLGYFTGNDYLNNSRSNFGKYLYIDSWCALAEGTGTSSGYKDYTIATIVHEFQHMIHWGTHGQKDTETWYNEMCSLLAEDMFQNMLNLKDDASPKGRAENFNMYYGEGNFFEWEKENTLRSYARSYIFGAYLCRKYGGASFVKEMIKHPATWEGIVEAVNVFEPGKSLSLIFADFAGACVNRNNDSGLDTLNKNAAENEYYDGYTYPMTGFSLWGYNQNGGSKKGPLIYSSSDSGSVPVYKNGFTLTKIGDGQEDVSIISFTGAGEDSPVDVYLIAVD